MKRKKIAYILYSEDKNDYKKIQNDKFYIVIAKYDFKKSTVILGERFDIIYCDSALIDLENGMYIISNIIRPTCKNFYLI